MRKFLYSTLIAVVAAITALCFFGCSADVSVSFGAEKITLYVGESRDILPYLLLTPHTGEIDAQFSCAGDCAELSGTTVRGVKAGTAVITVKAYDAEATLSVEVTARKASYIDIKTENAVQTATDDPSPVTVAAETDGDRKQVKWLANGQEYTGETVTFVPTGYGEFAVKASLDDIAAERTVSVYRPTHTQLRYNGNLMQSGAFSAVSFTAYEETDTRNPRSVAEWFVNGEKAATGFNFDFEPNIAGTYKIELYVNGVRVDEAALTASGGNAPTGILEFDDVGGVYLRRTNSVPLSFVSVVSPNGDRTTIEATDAQHAHLFSDGEIRLSEYIDVTAATPGEYTVVLGGNGRSEIKFSQYPAVAQAYLTDIVLARNSFISSPDDARLWIRELYACGKRNARAYAGAQAEELISAAYAAAGELGLTATIACENNVLSIELDEYVNAPRKSERHDDIAGFTQMPHIEYDAEKRRHASYVFGADRRKRTVEVNNSEQLLYAVTNGYRPTVRQGSEAARIYRLARNILLSIIGYDYTDRQKAHAIYDWLQWVTCDAENSEANMSGNYLESVFGSTGYEQAAGVRAAVTSVGAAKLFAFMCATEGMDCRICGDGTYGYNRIFIDGMWYNADVYGGKIRSEGRAFTSHRGLFLSDKGIADLLGAAYENTGASDEYTVYLEKYTYNGEYFDYHIDGAEQSDYGKIQAAVYRALDTATVGNVSIPFVGSTEMYYNNIAGAEFFAGAGVNVDTLVSAVTRAANEYAEEKFGAAFGERALRVTARNGVICMIAAVSVAAE